MLEMLNLDKLPDLNNLQIPLNAVLMIAGVFFAAQFVLRKAGSAVYASIKGAKDAIVSMIPIDNVKVASGYLGTGLFILGGATTTGYGISICKSNPTPPSIEKPEGMYKEALTKVKEGADPKTVDSLVKSYDQAETKRYEAAKANYDAQVSAQAQEANKPGGTPFICGGLATLVLGCLLGVRTGQRDTA